MLYQQIVKYQHEENWAKCLSEARLKYNLPLNDDNVKAMSKYQWKTFVSERINKYAFETLVHQCQNSAKTSYPKYDRFSQQSYFIYLGPAAAHIIFRARTRTLDIKANLRKLYSQDMLCLFSRECDERFDHTISFFVILMTEFMTFLIL